MQSKIYLSYKLQIFENALENRLKKCEICHAMVLLVQQTVCYARFE